LGVVTTLTGFARSWWVFDGLTHFRAQYAVFGLLLAAGLGALRSLRATVVAAVALVIALAHGWIWWDVPAAPRTKLCAGQELSAIGFNLKWSNPRPDAAVAALRKFAPDLLAVSENTTEWKRRLEALRDELPYHSSDPAESAANPALYSRLFVVDAETVWPFAAEANSSSIVLRRAATTYSYDFVHVHLEDGRQLAVFAVHAPGPGSRREQGLRNRYLAHLAAAVAKIDGPVVVLGDFNTSPWSPAYRDLVTAGGLTSASGGHIATWPVWFAPFRVPIDHILVRGPVTVLDATRGPDLGSDHFPVLARLCVGN